MKNIIKTVSLLTMFVMVSGAMAASPRVSVVGNTTSRLPSIAGRLLSGTTAVAMTTTSSTAAYYGDSECIEKYTDCVKEDDVCGSDFQECTTNVLFHGQMSKCISVLYQCSSSGINALFGTSAINALSNYDKSLHVKDGEIIDYTYPMAGSVLGRLIIGASITNKLTTEQCVRRYTNCIKRDDICGENFELCTTGKEFKKQAMLCDSTLQRCQNEGKQQLFGSVPNADNLRPDGESRLKQLIEEGASLAAKNAVLTCQKVTDNCLINACTKNPLRCVEGIKLDRIYTAEIVSGETDVTTTQNLGTVMTPGIDEDGNYVENYLEVQTGSDIRKMLKAQCLETIGMNKYCHMTYLEKKPTDKDLVDVDLQEEVFSLAYAARKGTVNTKIQEAVKKFDTNAKNNCVETIKSCAMRSCGGGLGSVCYRQSRLASSSTSLTSSAKYTDVHVNGDNTYGDILAGCAAIVNADANCIYAATSGGEDGYVYTYYDDNGENSTFNKLFPRYTENSTMVRTANNDPIGAVATLNALLATSYNDAAIENMKKQCQTIALSCVKSMCGKDYTNCYRNRTDIISGSYSTDVAKFDRSMNKMGGVLDYNIVQGLCMNTVKNSSVCEEHLKIAIAENWPDKRSDGDSWVGSDGNKYASVREAWGDANSTGIEQVVIACRASKQISMGGKDCSDTMEPIDGKCIGVMEGGCVYDTPVTSSMAEYVLTNSATTLFQELLMDVEKEVQAIYNAKLTKEQNICLANNNGGIMGSTDNGSTFMWVKLKSGRVPAAYQSKGLTTKQFTASNDLYGSFCRARVTISSDDKDIQDALGKDATAYFAVGDSFTCGSWISSETLQKISDTVGKRELCKQGYGKWVDGKCDGSQLSTKEKVTYAWATIAPALAGGAIGLGLTESGVLNKMMNKANEKNAVSKETITKWAGSCEEAAGRAVEKANELKTNDEFYAFKNTADLAEGAAATAYRACSAMGVEAREGCVSNLKIGYKTERVPGGNSALKLRDKNQAEQAIATFKAKMELLQATCENYVADNGENGRGAKAARIAIPIVTTLAGGALGAGITASVLKQKRENIQNEAAQKWMDEIGEHIQCYVGTDEVGTYGDVVSIELD